MWFLMRTVSHSLPRPCGFLCESGPTVSTIETHLTTAGTSTPAPHQPVTEIPLALSPCGSPTRRGSSSKIPAPGDYHGCATYRHRWPVTPYMAGLTGYLRPTGGGSQCHGDTWRPRSYPEPGGGSQSRGDTWRPRSCPTPRGGHRSRGDTWRPRSCPKPGGGRRSRGDTWHPWSCPEPGSGSRSRRDTWSPRSCPEPRGGNRSCGDTWRPWSCPNTGGGYHSTAPSSVPFRGQSGYDGACYAPR
jgi:hypothetical protein